MDKTTMARIAYFGPDMKPKVRTNVAVTCPECGVLYDFCEKPHKLCFPCFKGAVQRFAGILGMTGVIPVNQDQVNEMLKDYDERTAILDDERNKS